MKHRETGISKPIQLAALAVIVLASAILFQRYQSFIAETKVNEAIHLASESQIRVSEFYMLSGKFPNSEPEVNSVTSNIYNMPEFVQEISIEPEFNDSDVTIKIHFKADALKNNSGGEQFIYLAADRLGTSGQGLEWTCGAVGVDAELLPGNCS